MLWELRNDSQIGQEPADNLIFNALARLDSDPTFLEYREAIIQQDYAEYNGQHISAIQDIFANRGIGIPSTNPSVEISGPNYVPSGYIYPYVANPSGGTQIYTNYQWWERKDAEFSPAEPTGVWVALTQYDGQSTINRGHTYNFSLKVKVTDSGGATAVGVHSVTIQGLGKKSRNNIPIEYSMQQNYPNPFNPTTTIRYGLPESTPVSLVIYDLNGREIWKYSTNQQSAGWHQLEWNGTNNLGERVSTGVYLYKINAGSFVDVNKMLFMK